MSAFVIRLYGSAYQGVLVLAPWTVEAADAAGILWGGCTVYLCRKSCLMRIAFIAMGCLTAQLLQFMQSRWSLDCNLSGHVFYCILSAVAGTGEKTVFVCIHASFLVWTFYCYGTAAYSVTAFLFVVFMVSVKKQLNGGTAVCGNIYAGGLPEAIVL